MLCRDDKETILSGVHHAKTLVGEAVGEAAAPNVILSLGGQC